MCNKQDFLKNDNSFVIKNWKVSQFIVLINKFVITY